MGLCSSSSDVQPLHANATEKKTHRDAGPLSGLALSFPYVRKTYNNVKRVFEARAGKDEEVDPSKMGEMLRELGAKHITEEQIHELFNSSDLDESKAMSWREFLIAVGTGVYLNDHVNEEDSDDPQFKENRKGFQVAQKAFQKIDT